MQVIFPCPNCGTEYNITDGFFDHPLQCQKCQHVFTVSSPDEAEVKQKSHDVSTGPLNSFVVKYKKALLIFAVLLLLLVVLLMVSLMHRYNYCLPPSLLQVASYVGTPVQRARAFQKLALRARNHVGSPEEKEAKMKYYFQKGYEVLKGCEETPEVLRLIIALKYNHDMSGSISEEAERLIKIDKSYIFKYVTTKFFLNRKGFGQKEIALLEEYEAYMLGKFEAEPDLITAVELARLYYFDAPGSVVDLEKMEFYLHKAQEFSKSESDFWHNWLLVECYVMQGKFEELDRFAEDFVKKHSYKTPVCSLALMMTRIYSGKYSSSDIYRHGMILKTPRDDAKAMRWKTLAEKLNPNLIW